MKIGCWEVPKPTDPSLLWLAEWKVPAPLRLNLSISTLGKLENHKKKHIFILISQCVCHWIGYKDTRSSLQSRLSKRQIKLNSFPQLYNHIFLLRTPSIVKGNKSLKSNQIAPFIYIMIELCSFSLVQWEIRIHLLWGKCFNIPHNCDPHLNQTKWLNS